MSTTPIKDGAEGYTDAVYPNEAVEVLAHIHDAFMAGVYWLINTIADGGSDAQLQAITDEAHEYALKKRGVSDVVG